MRRLRGVRSCYVVDADGCVDGSVGGVVVLLVFHGAFLSKVRPMDAISARLGNTA